MMLGVLMLPDDSQNIVPHLSRTFGANLSTAPTRRRFRFVASLLGVATAAMLFPATARAQLILEGQTIQERSLRPGDDVLDSVIVSNPTTDALHARIYLTDYVFDAAGATRYDTGPSHARSSVPWMLLSQEDVVVAPGAHLAIRYRTRVPLDEQRPGSFWCMLMIEGVNDATDAAARALGLRATVRYGVQLVTHMPTLGVQNASISAPKVIVSDSTTMVEFDVTNTGERAFRPTVTMELYDAAGQRSDTQRSKRGLLYPRTALRQQFPFVETFTSSYLAVIFIDTGLDQVFAVRLPIKRR